jgi:hypothetical protein
VPPCPRTRWSRRSGGGRWPGGCPATRTLCAAAAPRWTPARPAAARPPGAKVKKQRPNNKSIHANTTIIFVSVSQNKHPTRAAQPPAATSFGRFASSCTLLVTGNLSLPFVLDDSPPYRKAGHSAGAGPVLERGEHARGAAAVEEREQAVHGKHVHVGQQRARHHQRRPLKNSGLFCCSKTSVCCMGLELLESV